MRIPRRILPEFRAVAERPGGACARPCGQRRDACRVRRLARASADEYPLELSGTAWIVPQTGTIARIEAGIGDTLQDVGLKSLQAEIEFAPLPLADPKLIYWFPTRASVEVQTPRQHWRNLHQFAEYKKFSVATQEKVNSQ